MHVDPDKTRVIANPAASGGWVGRKLPHLRELLEEILGVTDVVLTESQGHGIELARRAIWEGNTLLLSLGGDGTHSEVARGIVREQTQLGRITQCVLPAGTGGDFRRMLYGSSSVDDHARRLLDAEPVRIDVGRLKTTDDLGEEREQIFLNETSFGVSAWVCQWVNNSNKLLGSFTYDLATTLSLGYYRPPRVRLYIDGQSVGEFVPSAVVCCNGKWAGGGMRFAPDALLDDGLLDVTVIRQANPVAMLTVPPSLYLDRIHDHPLIEFFRGNSIEVEVLDPGKNAMVEADGEVLEGKGFRAEVMPSVLQIVGVLPG